VELADREITGMVRRLNLLGGIRGEQEASHASSLVPSGKYNYVTLRGTESESLMISEMFGFDEAWEDWLSTDRDSSDDKPLTLF
jgi:hypothetical protein